MISGLSGLSGLSGVMGAASAYDSMPVVSNSRLWLSRGFGVYSDVAGTTPQATPGGQVASWKAVGGSWGTDLAAQSTAGLRPLLQTDGLQDAGSMTSVLTLPADIACTGDFTLYWVSSRTAGTQAVVPLASDPADGKFGYVKEGQPGNTDVFSSDAGAATTIADAEFTASPGSIKRFRRSGTTGYLDLAGVAEASAAVHNGTITFRKVFLAGASTGSSPSTRIMQIVLVTKSITPGDADDLAIIAKLQELEPGAIGP